MFGFTTRLKLQLLQLLFCHYQCMFEMQYILLLSSCYFLRTLLLQFLNPVILYIYFVTGCSNDLGMESRKIKKSQLSSNTNDKGWDADYGRLRNSKAWCSKNKDRASEYFQIDLLRVRHVSAIATQGVEYLIFDYYVETYMIKYSYDGSTWFYYESENGVNVVSDSVSLEYFNCQRFTALPVPFYAVVLIQLVKLSSPFWQVIDCYSILL